MDAENIVKLTRETIRELVDSRQVHVHEKNPHGNRGEQRWPFPGTVEIWLPDECYGERHILATLHNLSHHGLAMRTRRPVAADVKISLAIHQPELSCYGNGVVRHCTRAEHGYLVGVEFYYPPENRQQ